MTLSSCARFPYERLYARRTPAPRLAAAVTIAAPLFVAPSQGAAVEQEAFGNQLHPSGDGGPGTTPGRDRPRGYRALGGAHCLGPAGEPATVQQLRP